MDAITAIHTRRSIKRYTSDPVPREKLEQLMEAAYDAPSGANRRPYEFVVTTDRAAIERLAEAHKFCGWLKGAPAAIVIATDPTKGRYWLEDASVAAENMWIAATAMGLGMAWSAIHQFGDAEETARREAIVREAVGIPENLGTPIVLAVGNPDGEPSERKRPPLESMVHWDRY